MPKAWTIKRSATLKDLRDSTLSERERIGYDGSPKGKGRVAMMFAARGMALVSSARLLDLSESRRWSMSCWSGKEASA